jgi:mannose-1-phosphate guanylyltransferase
MKPNVPGSCWALILAGGEGSRLRSLTTTVAGVAIPKQYCSLRGGCSLLHEALKRAESIALPQQICAVVASQHRDWWQTALQQLPPKNVVIQPGNCGTASGILLPLLAIMTWDPDGTVVILPSDHHVEDEAILAGALREAVRSLGLHPNDVLLLGIAPDEPDPELGYIVPGMTDGKGTAAVLKFVEKPQAAEAKKLIAEGALWNAFIMAGRAEALLSLFAENAPELLLRMRRALEESSQRSDPATLEHLYRTLTPLDFSRHILRGQEAHLRVMRVPPCGWTDLGTPKRVAVMLGRACPCKAESFDSLQGSGALNLAAQYRRREQESTVPFLTHRRTAGL